MCSYERSDNKCSGMLHFVICVAVFLQMLLPAVSTSWKCHIIKDHLLSLQLVMGPVLQRATAT